MRDIEIKDGEVFKEGKFVGEVRKFCCGIDFRPEESQGLFSILGVKMGSYQLKKSVDAILSIQHPDKYFHWNFKYETAKDKAKLKEYETLLLKNA